ncbi:MAG TPA: hypothetical protein VLA31_05175, partial [Burkholderiaceae bacterium]|nr:hypothetical protein [Burkholderiaceae bacterium]
TQGLDQPGEAAFYRLIETVRQDTGAAVLMVSHDLHVVMAASDRVICLNGHVCCSGRPDTVMRDPAYLGLFGERAAAGLALYAHQHDHAHDLPPDEVAADGMATGELGSPDTQPGTPAAGGEG